ncbi:hypothetical protein MRT09_25425, partial [Escherichia coli]|nr:hypothetical protein [Escherichia coli]
IFLFTVSGGTLWYLGGMIQANLEEIRKQNENLEKLNAKTWGVTCLNSLHLSDIFYFNKVLING